MTMTKKIVSFWWTVAACLSATTTTNVVHAQGWSTAPLELEQELCVEGYVMDMFCINRGTLLDPSGVPTLGADGPLRHTVHCLVDVPQCNSSDFEILLPAPATGASDPFVRGWRLSEATKSATLDLAREVGSYTAGCTTCTQDEGTLEAGFHVGMNVRVVDLGDAGTPPTIELIATTGWRQSGVLVATDPSDTMDDHCAGGSAYPPNQLTLAPTAVPQTLAPTVSDQGDVVLQAFSTSIEASAGRADVDFVVDPDQGSVTITMTLQESDARWMAIGASPDNTMPGTTACIARPDLAGEDPKLYSIDGFGADSIVELPADLQTLISSSHVVQDGVNILECTVPLDLTGEDQFSWSTRNSSPMVVAWGSSSSFVQHVITDRIKNLSVPPLQPVTDPVVGDEICVEGYLMDYLCIAQGTLVDNPTVESLSVAQEGPFVHSVKCILDVPDCLDSPFHIVPPAEVGDEYFDQGWRLDAASKEAAIATARAAGVCGNECVGDQDSGLYLTMTATINSLGSNSAPAEISATNIQVASPDDESCSFITRPPFPLPRVGDEVCIEGFVMDVFCINRGTLFDNSSIRTLSPEGGPSHSVHCLIDVQDCINSDYEILIPPLVAGENNVRGWRLDPETKAEVVALAKAQGICSDCDGGGTIRSGFHVSFTAEILDRGTTDLPPTVKATSVVMTNSPSDLKCEGGTARPPPFVSIGEPDENEVLDGLSFSVTDNGDNTASYEMTFVGEAWVSLGVSTDGLMVGAQAVIGLPDDDQDPQIYNLNDRVVSGVVPAPAESQILISSSVTQQDGVTVLAFTVPLETDGFRVSATGVTGYLAAHGSDNNLGLHRARIPFESNLSGGVEVAEIPDSQYKAHGILMAIAWGVLCPIAIGASLLRSLFPPGMFFQIHRALNSLVVLFTIIGFGLAVKATNIEGLDHFSGVSHRRVGLIIFLFAVVQAGNGALRPHAPHNNDDGTVEEKTQVRFVWEIGHRVLGLVTLFMAWSNCSTGLEQYFLKFDSGSDDENTLRAVFWAFAAGLSGVIVIGYAGVTAKKLSSPSDEAGPKKEKKEEEQDA